MKLPFRPQKNQPVEASASTAVPTGQLSLRAQSILLLVGGVVSILAPVAVVIVQTTLQVTEARQQQAALVAKVFAGAIGQWVDNQTAAADLLAKDPKLARLMIEGSESERDAKAQELAYLFPTSIRVRLLPTGIEEVNLETSPPISYAALDMLRHAETKETPPPVEVHMSGTPQQHVNLVRRILDPTGRRIAGHLMVSYSVQQLQAAVEARQLDGYVELQQVVEGPVVLATHGTADLKGAEVDSEVPVTGSLWRVAYWAPDSASARGARQTVAAVAVGLAALLFSLLLWLVSRRVTSALRRDQATLLTIVKDLRAGRRRKEYPSSLAELHDTIELMARSASAGLPPAAQTTPAVAAEEGDRQPPHRESHEEVDADLLFDDAALDISRVDESEGALDASIFRAYDIRGIVGETLSADVAFEIGRAIGSEAYYRGEQTEVVGRDGRISGPELSEALIRGLTATGRDVKDVGEVPTPVLYFAAQQFDANSGVMVTGSHNPPDYNGFKIVLGGETLASEAIQGLRRRIESGDLLTGDGSVEQLDVVPDYIERVRSDVQLARPARVAIDCGNGVAAKVAPQLLQALGCEISELYCDVDGTFPNHHPDPSKAENLSDLIKVVQQHGADLGIAFDGDGDRVGIISSQGEIIWPDRVLMLLAMDVLSRQPGALIIYDVKCSRHVADVVAQYGGEPLMCATGHSLIKAKMKETGALLAGEMSGHVFFKERWYGFDDGLYTAARLLEILANDQRSSSEIFAALPDSINTPELTVPMAEGEPMRYMDRLLEVAQFEGASVITIDGMRVEFDDGWGLVRASNTTPCLVLRFEARDELALSRIQDDFRRVMLQADPSLSLPF
jgi:phosphomannomutase/phosphoglucomutase